MIVSQLEAVGCHCLSDQTGSFVTATPLSSSCESPAVLLQEWLMKKMGTKYFLKQSVGE